MKKLTTLTIMLLIAASLILWRPSKAECFNCFSCAGPCVTEFNQLVNQCVQAGESSGVCNMRYLPGFYVCYDISCPGCNTQGGCFDPITFKWMKACI